MKIPSKNTPKIEKPKALASALICLTLCLGLFACGGGGEDTEAPKKEEGTKSESKKETKDKETEEKGAKDKKSKGDKDEKESKSKRSPEKEAYSEEEVKAFLKRTGKRLDKHLKLAKTIQKAAAEYEMEHGRRKKWKGNHVLVTIDSSGSVMDTKFETEIPSIEFQDINDAFEDAIEEARPFKNPPVAKGKTFVFRVRLWGTKSYVTEYVKGEDD